jgi:hypothetical protein
MVEQRLARPRLHLYCVPRTKRCLAGAGNVIETHEHTGDFKEWEPQQMLMQSETSRHGPMIGCIRPGNCGLRRS